MLGLACTLSGTPLARIDALDFNKAIPAFAAARGAEYGRYGPWSRKRRGRTRSATTTTLGSAWEGGRSVVEAKHDIPHMERSQARLWRYRQEQVAGAQQYRDVFLPQALVDGEQA